MTRTRISSGSKFEAEIGYSRAIVDGDWIWVSGTTGFNYETMTISEDVAEQAEQTLPEHQGSAGQGRVFLRGRGARQLHPAEGARIFRPAGRCFASISARSARPRP